VVIPPDARRGEHIDAAPPVLQPSARSRRRSRTGDIETVVARARTSAGRTAPLPGADDATALLPPGFESLPGPRLRTVDDAVSEHPRCATSRCWTTTASSHAEGGSPPPPGGRAGRAQTAASTLFAWIRT
jgi:hypothetical protein